MQFLVKRRQVCCSVILLFTILTGFILLFSGHWHISNFGNIFQSTLDSVYGIPGWVIGMALLITPYFGFETVPQMVEEGDFPIKSSKKAICGSILTCGCQVTWSSILRSRTGWIKRCIYQLCTGWLPDHCYHAERTGLDFLADRCRHSFLPLRYGRFLTGILDVYRPYAVLHGEQKLFAENICKSEQK